ncbi:MAG: DUF2490 domain-containing protein [Draconibacterium sp.]|nr:DUF2490 domain-containing protein [Draconibacterium sp.]
MNRLIILVIFIFVGILSISAKTEKFGTWVEMEFTKTFLKKFEFSFIPEVRWQDDFTVDKYQFDGRLAYQPFKFLEVAAAYRIKTNVKAKGDVVTHRLVLDAKISKNFNRFKTSLRARYTTYNNVDGDGKTNFVRPRIKAAYDIKGNKFTPFTSYELFQNLSDKVLQKGRFDIGVSRKMGKMHRLAIFYRLQHYYVDRPSINILGIDYRFKI